MLYLIGLGLSDERDITVRGLEVVRQCARVYLEAYTSVLLVDKAVLEKYYGRQVVVADRELVESGSEEILKDAQTVDVAFLVVGDPYGATTHTDLVLRARALDIPIRSIPNASILSAIGSCGLQLYHFGQTVSLVFFTPTWRPASFHARVAENRRLGLHTLFLLDIKVREQSEENMARGRRVYEPPRFMTVGVAATQMLEVVEEMAERKRRREARRQEREKRGDACTTQTTGQPNEPLDDDDDEDDSLPSNDEPAYTEDSLAIGAARVGGQSETYVSGTLRELCAADDRLGPPLHSLVLIGARMHELERDYVRAFAVDKDRWDEIVARDYMG